MDLVKDNDVLTQTLHSLTVDQLTEIKQIAHSLFARLVRPFQQAKVDWEFSFRSTIRKAMRTGQLLPVYDRVTKAQPKSTIVIAMSLSGIDRCYAVGLIPLLSEIHKFLDFKLYIYTDNLVEAKFTNDGFLENDCDIAWNNVIAPTVFHKLSEIEVEGRNNKLLIVDSMGGGDSLWYTNWYADYSADALKAQKEFIGDTDWSTAREWLNGHYDRIRDMPKNIVPAEWQEKVNKNVEGRWVKTPAMLEYLIRYIFNPRFGQVKHGKYPRDWYYNQKLENILPNVKEKFSSVHWMLPAPNESVVSEFERYGFVDFFHRTDSLEGFSQMLVNMVYGRETNRLTVPRIRFLSYKIKATGDDYGVAGHSELTKTFKDCFATCTAPAQCLPETKVQVAYRNLERTSIRQVEIAYSKLSVVLNSFSLGEMISYFPKWSGSRAWSSFSKEKVFEEVISFIKFNKFAVDEYGKMNIRRVTNGDVRNPLPEPDFETFRTRALKQNYYDMLSLVSDVYLNKYLSKLPLRSVVWCSLGKFRHDLLAISARPADSDQDKKETVFHEMGHWLEHACPAIGMFTNSILLSFCAGVQNLQKLTKLRKGEYAAPVTLAGRKPWIKEYAGKWYKKVDSDLPNPTEILSVHLEYFTSADKLIELLEHDSFMVKAVAFALMGGPEAWLESEIFKKNNRAIMDIEQKGMRSSYYVPTGKKRGRPKGSKSSGSDSSEDSPRMYDFGI